jgi:hypothetical protein
MNAVTTQEALELAEQPRAAALPAVQQQTPPATMPARQLSVVEYAVASGAPVSEVRALVELQIQMDNHKLAMLKQQDEREREERRMAAKLAFDEAFAAFRGENVIIPKSKHVDRGRAGSFMQAEFDSVCRLLSPPLAKHGFSFRHDQKFGTKPWPTPENEHNVVGWVWVTCYLTRSGHTETLELEGPQDDQTANTPVQNMQSTASYLKRQSLLAITGTATGGEDDENRKRGGGGAEASALEKLVEAGRAEAKNGLSALTEWWRARTPREQKDLQGEYGAMRKTAQAADRGQHHE